MMPLTTLSLALLFSALGQAQPAPAPATAPADAPVIQPTIARTNQSLAEAVAALVKAHPNQVRATTYGTSAGRTPLTALTLSSNLDTADSRPGILLVAGLDGARWASTETALAMAEQLLTKHPQLLDTVTVYVMPRANPDPAEAFAKGPKMDYSGNVMQHDNDRDRRTGENPPQDLNGDGFITIIRTKDAPPPYDNPTLVADPSDPRILKKPDPLKGEVAEYTVFTEGVDLDGDARIAEDGPGGVVMDRNFPQRWPEFEDEAGAFPLAAPEAEAVVRWVTAHPSLVAAYVIGRLDTVVNAPDGKAKTEVNQPAMIGEEDAKAYAEVARKYREIVGQTRATEADSGGSLVAWLNAQRGVPTFATQLWGRPDAPPKAGEEKKPADGADGKPADKTADKPADAAPGGAPPAGDAPPAGGRSRRGGRGGPPPARPAPTSTEKVEAVSADDAAWLAVSDAQGGAGFVKWTTVQHPQLGTVEVGGWVPGWRENPPLDQVPVLAAKNADFIQYLAESRAQVQLETPQVQIMGPGVYLVRTRLLNRGRLPTMEQGGRNNGTTPAHVVRVSTPVDRIKSGQRMQVVRGLSPGDARAMEWMITAAPEEVIELELLFAGKPIGSFSIRNGEVLK